MINSQWQLKEKVQPGSAREVLSLLLHSRGADLTYLGCTLKDLETYLDILGLNEGAQLMARHLVDGSKILIVGDYDCDGVTSVAQVSLFLNEIGYRRYEVVIPSRDEGYGIPERSVIDNPDAALLVAVDCGTLDFKPIELARSRGADCIVIDHHEVPETGLAPASVLINPKQAGCPSVFKEFCSSGLTLLFLARLRKALQGSFELPSLGGKYLELAAIGTVADLVPLVEGNRILVKAGLSSINRKSYAPVQHLVKCSGLSGKPITAGHISYYLGPRINAAGRMGDAQIALKLLMSDEGEEVEGLARDLNSLNAKRQYQEDIILEEIRRRFEHLKNGQRTIVMGDHRWHLGIVGIIASRVQQELQYGPTVIFSIDEEKGTARGSARSVPGFDIHAALKHCEDLLIKWGGHKMAAGMTISLDQMERFSERLENLAKAHPSEVFVSKGRVDLELDLRLISAELVQMLKTLEPHGLGNPIPTFAARKVTAAVQKAFGRDKNHLRVLLDGIVDGVFWRGAQRFQSGQTGNGEALDVVFQLEWDSFCKKPVLNIKDMGRFF